MDDTMSAAIDFLQMQNPNETLASVVGLGPNQRRPKLGDIARSLGPKALEFSASMSPKSRIGEWGVHICAGIMDRIENEFQWNDIHYKLPKSELLVRTKEWNTALEQCCDDFGLTGEERDKVIKQHTASPLAPCGNTTCDVFEEAVKEFAACSRCKSIAYSSRTCQKMHWKEHKEWCY